MNRPQFVEDEIYHVYNRGVEKRKIFLNNKDYFRFIHGMREFNDKNPTENTLYYLSKSYIEVSPRYREPLVEILVFVLMPNHFHFLLKQKQENGISKFMQKLGTGYTMYFNKKNERVGSLFQGNFKSVLIEHESQYIHIASYIHINPLKLFPYRGFPYRGPYRGFTSIGLPSIGLREKMEFLENYQWSSYPDYIGKKNFPALTSRDLYLKFFGGEERYKKEIERLLKTNRDFSIEVEPR